MRSKYEGFYTLFSCQDNADCLKHLFMFKLIATASSKFFSQKPADHTFISCLFLFYMHIMPFSLSCSILKSTSTAQAKLPVIYVFIFQTLVKFCYKIKQPAPPSPVFVVHLKLLKSCKKDQIFHCFALWFGLLIFQHGCSTDLRKISLVRLK